MSAEINEAVARKLGVQCAWTDPLTGEPDHAHKIPAYSTSIAAAWEIVEFMSQREIGTYLFGGISKTWHCDLHTHPAGYDDPKVSESADTAPLAICQAFLKLKGAE